MNLIDVINNLDLLPKGLRRALALALLVGIAYVPPVRDLYLDQARMRGEQVARVITTAWAEAPAPRPTDGTVTVDRAPQGQRNQPGARSVSTTHSGRDSE